MLMLWQQIYMPPGGSLRLQGFVSSASFLRGVLDKVGLEPVVVRIGKYKCVRANFRLKQCMQKECSYPSACRRESMRCLAILSV